MENVTLPGTGVVVAADDVGGVLIQRVKLVSGPDGTSDGDHSGANPYPVIDAAGNTLAGSVTETAPGTDTASSGLNGRLQRVAQRLTTLIADIGTMSAKLPASLGIKTAAASLSVAPASDAKFKVEPLGIPGVARTLSVGSASANTALTSACRRASILALTADVCFEVGSASQTATTSSHYLMAGERLDIALPATPNIAVIRAGSTDGSLRVMELLESV